MKFIWTQYGNTAILLQSHNEYEIPEWRPVAYVILRQVYEGEKPFWSSAVGESTIGRFESLEDAKKAAEISLG